MQYDKMRYFRLFGMNGEPANKIMFGEVQEETETHISISGMYLVFTEQAVDPIEEDIVPSKCAAHMEPFSPVGNKVQTMTIPKSRIAEEFTEMPAQFAHAMAAIYAGEALNAKMRDKALSMPVPTRAAQTPEEALAMVAQYLHEHGELPQSSADAGSTSIFQSMGIEAGVFKSNPTSPYREENQ